MVTPVRTAHPDLAIVRLSSALGEAAGRVGMGPAPRTAPGSSAKPQRSGRGGPRRRTSIRQRCRPRPGSTPRAAQRGRPARPGRASASTGHQGHPEAPRHRIHEREGRLRAYARPERPRSRSAWMTTAATTNEASPARRPALAGERPDAERCEAQTGQGDRRTKTSRIVGALGERVPRGMRRPPPPGPGGGPAAHGDLRCPHGQKNLYGLVLADRLE